MHWACLVLFPVSVLFCSISGDLAIGLRGLQQIRTLVPERLVDEEFAIVVDRKAFEQPLKKLSSHPLRESVIPCAQGIGTSRFYYLHWTISGEPIRVLDFYQEFEYGPYWLYPTAMERLWEMYYRDLKRQP